MYTCIEIIIAIAFNIPFPRYQRHSQTTDITHFAIVFHYDITTKALEICETQSITYDVIAKTTAKCVMSVVRRVKSRF